MLFNPDFALWSYSSINQMCMQINPSSGIANDEHLRYFHFTGRLLGKALFDRQIVAGHLVRPLFMIPCLTLKRRWPQNYPNRYKHILGWPLTVADLEQLDADTYANLCKLKDLDDVEVFTSVIFTISITNHPISIGMLSWLYSDRGSLGHCSNSWA